MSNRIPGGIADDGSNVVFLLSSPRAGSTLLSAILNRHSRILCPAEPWFLLSLHALYHGSGTGIAAYDQRLADMGLRELAGENEFLRAARAFASSLYSSRLVTTGRSVFVDKTPRYYHILPFLAALFPRARMIWLRRNPLDVAASYKTSWGVQVAELVGRILSPNSFDLTLGLLNFGAWFDGSPSRFEVSYEELVANPDGVVERVLGFLKLEAESGLTDYGADTEAMSVFRQSSLGDRKVLESTRPHGRSVGQWREILSSGELDELLSGVGTDSFIRMGYEDVLAEAAAKAGIRFDDGHKVPRHLDKLRLYQQWYAAALPVEKTEPDIAPRKAGAPEGVFDVRIAVLEARLAAAESDREARLAVIQKQGAELGRISGLDAERDKLATRLAAAESDREARLAVIQKQGAELGRISGLEAERDKLATRLAAAEADREARLAVIQKQGAELGRISGLEAERDELATRLAAAEADREAHLAVIQKQGAELGRLPGLEVKRDELTVERDALAAELSSLRSTLEDVRRFAKGVRPKTFLGMAPPFEVRRLAEVLSSIATLAEPRRGPT